MFRSPYAVAPRYPEAYSADYRVALQLCDHRSLSFAYDAVVALGLADGVLAPAMPDVEAFGQWIYSPQAGGLAATEWSDCMS